VTRRGQFGWRGKRKIRKRHHPRKKEKTVDTHNQAKGRRGGRGSAQERGREASVHKRQELGGKNEKKTRTLTGDCEWFHGRGTEELEFHRRKKWGRRIESAGSRERSPSKGLRATLGGDSYRQRAQGGRGKKRLRER